MTKIKLMLFSLILISIASASEHGMYLRIVKNAQGDIDVVAKQIAAELEKTNYEILSLHTPVTPDYVNEERENLCGFQARLILFSSKDYRAFLTTNKNKYLVAGFLRIGLYETPEGIQVVMADPETINRIVFNDIYENDDEEGYKNVVTKTIDFKKQILESVHSLSLGENLEEAREPIRDDEDLAESSKDMFMMVGPMTFFNDEDQFQLIYTARAEGSDDFEKIRTLLKKNISKFTPTEDDVDYRWYPNKGDLKWELLGEVFSPDSSAAILGLTRKRTEGVSFRIVGGSGVEGNSCPGIDHLCAYPIEVLLIHEDNLVKIYTQREMFRMDMYFWDAGMAAFMDHMSMPGILDEAIGRALLGSAYSGN